MPSILEAIEGLKRSSIAQPVRDLAPTSEQIEMAQAQLEIEFPSSFLTFLENAGSYKLPYWQTFWIGDESLGWRNIVKVNFSERDETNSGLPPFLIAFFNNGCGDLDCFDTRTRRIDGEYTIVFWDHELTREENLSNLEPIADSFAEWLEDQVKDSQVA